MQVLPPGGDGIPQLGPAATIELDADDLQICGPGFNASTLRIRNGEAYYYVFREDLERFGLFHFQKESESSGMPF